MKILIAIDKFKGSLTSLEAAQAIRKGIGESIAEAVVSEPVGGLANTYEIVEIADGGDGSANVLQSLKRDVKSVTRFAADPLGHNFESSYLLYTEERKCAFIEMAKVSGLELVSIKERNPLIATTYGLGQLILAAYRSSAKKITLSIGGSATNDGGTGMLQALGFRFYNRQGELITDYMCGGLLGEIEKIAMPLQGSEGAKLLSHLKNGECEIEVICDVTNPLLGKNGATMVYAPQKGADKSMLQQLERGMENLVKVVSESDCKLHSECVLSHLLPGAGAAGGVGYAVKAFLNGKIISGWRFFAGITGLEEKIREADLVISGEGRIDSQSLSGKVIDGVLNLAGKYNKPVWLFCGINALQEEEVESVAKSVGLSGKVRIFQLADMEPDKEQSIKNATALLERLAYMRFGSSKIFMQI